MWGAFHKGRIIFGVNCHSLFIFHDLAANVSKKLKSKGVCYVASISLNFILIKSPLHPKLPKFNRSSFVNMKFRRCEIIELKFIHP